MGVSDSNVILTLSVAIWVWMSPLNVRDCIAITGYWSETIFIISLKKILFLQNCLKYLLVVTCLPHLLNFSVKTLTLLVLLKCKLFKFTFMGTFYINDNNNEKLYGPFLWRGSTASRLESLWGGSSLNAWILL